MIKNCYFKKRNNENSIEYFINHMEQKLVFYICFYQCFVSFFDVLIGMILLSLVFNFNFFFIKNSSDKNIPHR